MKRLDLNAVETICLKRTPPCNMLIVQSVIGELVHICKQKQQI